MQQRGRDQLAQKSDALKSAYSDKNRNNGGNKEQLLVISKELPIGFKPTTLIVGGILLLTEAVISVAAGPIVVPALIGATVAGAVAGKCLENKMKPVIVSSSSNKK